MPQKKSNKKLVKSKKLKPADKDLPNKHHEEATGTELLSENKLPGVLYLFKTAINLLYKNYRLFGGIFVIYLFLMGFFVRGIAGNIDVPGLRQSLSANTDAGQIGPVAASVALYTYMIGTVGETGQAAGTLQFIIFVITSLAIIWALRQAYSNATPHFKYAFYKGMYPLIPFLLTLGIMALQLMPLLIGSTMYSAVILNGLAVSGIEIAAWSLLFVLLTTISLYMFTSSVMSLFVVTLPDTTPLAAVRTAKKLVSKRRAKVLLKIIALPFLLIIVSGIIMIPIILVVPVVAEPFFFGLTSAGVFVAHSYLYSLYRSLL